MSDDVFSGHIRINGMRFWGRHGARPNEKDRTQPIDVDVDIAADLAKSSTSDSLADALDYDGVYAMCERIVTGQSFTLLEALARRIGESILEDARVREAVIRVRKPRLLNGATPEIEIRLQRHSREPNT